MKTGRYIVMVLTILGLAGCVDEFVPGVIVDHRGFLVVEGTVADGETVVKLSLSRALLTGVGPWIEPRPVLGARVWVESEEGARFEGRQEAYDPRVAGVGTYRIQTGDLDGNTRYRVRIEAQDEEYVSGWRTPKPTPPIERVELFTGGRGGHVVQVRLNVTGEEDGPRHYLWKYGNSRELLIGSTEMLSTNTIRDYVLFEFPPPNVRERFYLKVLQYAIGGDAYHYLSNLKRNTEQMGTLFSPVPSEMSGNVVCTSNPELSAIGFVEVSRLAEYELSVPIGPTNSQATLSSSQTIIFKNT